MQASSIYEEPLDFIETGTLFPSHQEWQEDDHDMDLFFKSNYNLDSLEL